MEKRILILNTGGTLSSKMGERGLAPALGRDEILKDMEWLARDCSLDFEDICSLDSANILPSDWARMAERIGGVWRDYSGVVIIHGTDTMAYTASMLTWMLENIPIPVVLTGSQLSITHPVADAMENCRLALYMAASGRPGVYVAFNRKIMLGCRTSKVRTISFDAFESINFPDVAVLNARGMAVRETEIPVCPGPFEVRSGYSDRVFLLKLVPGLDPAVLPALAGMGYRGIVIEAFGLGGVPSRERDMAAAVAGAVRDGLLVAVGTQCRYDGSDLTVYETGRAVLSGGVLRAGDMTTEAAVTRLMWALGQTEDRTEAARLFAAWRQGACPAGEGRNCTQGG